MQVSQRGANSHIPRLVFTYKESTVKTFTLHEQNLLISLEGQPDAVISVKKTHLDFYHFKNSEKVPKKKKVVWEECPNNDCNITVVIQRKEGKLLFVCRTSSTRTECCEMDLSKELLTCVPTAKMDNIREFVIKEGEHSLLVETENSTDLYLTYSGAQEHVGIHKFGSKRVRPANHYKEQYYVGLVLSRRQYEVSQNKVYAFYKEKNKDTQLDSDMWLPYVSQVCMADAGGPKKKLQFSWTSLMNARLYCGHPDRKQHFSELVDVATVHSDRWQDTRVYALFRNEWGISAVCVYTIGDIDSIFTSSPFSGSNTDDDVDKQRKTCVPDSTRVTPDVLKKIETVSEMKEWVLPEKKFGPILFKLHNYTGIYVDAFPGNPHTVMFLSLSNGIIHKALHLENHSFVIAEYQPFNHSTHILSVILDPTFRKLYVSSKTELVQMNVENCGQYGKTCQDCVLSRDPYCSWKSNKCTSDTSGTFPVVRGNLTICSEDQGSTLRLSAEDSARPTAKNGDVTVPFQSSYFLRCPMSSHHAQYTWHSPEGSSSCNPGEGKCILLIDRMTPKQEGDYTCESEEMGYRKVLTQFHLRITSAGRTFGPTVWVCVVAVFSKSIWF
ncbi:hypothetical protein CRENBAI_006521 [Crenichthys baileyi]|uniref:Sema domain-containing protein n=1 Tax=Crenichthys baileyi TaxID=28760 RepID=A0AAV9R7N9_9TELE